MRVNRPKITLSPWEVTPNVEIRPKSIGSFFHILMSMDGPRRPVGTIKHPITTDGYHAVFLRFLDEEDEGSWVILDSNGYSKYRGSKSSFRLPWRLNHDEIGNYPYLGRLFNSSALGIGDDRFIITVGSYNSAAIQSISDSYCHARFKLDSHKIGLIFDTPFATIKAILQREISLPDSDGSFALKWLAIRSIEEQFRFAYRLQRGQWDEFIALLQAVEILFPATRRNFFFLSERDSEWMYRTFKGIPKSETRRQYLWNLELVRYFQPFIAPDLQRYTCLRDWSSGAGKTYHFFDEKASAHEKIEAILLLSNWAQDKMSAKKLKLLLPF